MRILTGDLFTSDAPAFAHGVNVDGAMGAGIALVFRRRWPAMFETYRDLCRTGDLVPGTVMAWQADDTPVIYNLASQDRPGPCARLAWLTSSVRLMLVDAAERGLDRVAMPWVGCGIGGLDVDDVTATLLAVESSGPGVSLDVWQLP